MTRRVLAMAVVDLSHVTVRILVAASRRLLVLPRSLS